MTLALVVCAAALLCCAAAQDAVSSKAPAKASFEGIVVKEPGGEPLKKAIIELIGEDQGESGNYTATSDVEGHFKITAIQPGRYRLFVERTGYLEAQGKFRHAIGLTFSFQAGQEVKDQVLRMVPAAIITGRVVDEEGDPMPDVSITSFRRKRTTGGLKFERSASAATDDLGEYRIRGLLSGSYYLSATPLPNFQSLVPVQKNPDDPATPATDLSYVPTFYPNTTDRTAASPVEVHAGDDVPVNFSLERVHTAHIRGTVEGLASGARAVVMLRGKESDLMFNSADSGKDGKFELLHVAPGSYTLVAMTFMSDTSQFVLHALDVGESNIDDLRLSPQPGATLRGQVHFPKSFRGDSSQVTLSLHGYDRENEFFDHLVFGADDDSGFRSSVKLKPGGSFELKNVPVGRYEVYVSADSKAAADSYVESIVSGMKDVVDTGLDISGGTVSVDITVSTEAGVINGTVTNDKGEAVPNATVVAVPDPKFRKNFFRYAHTATDQSGHFTMRGIRPGDYKVLAWEVLDSDDYLDPDFLAPVESKGAETKVEKGGHPSVSLKLIPAPTDQP
jgi:hypothetical protein